MSATMKALRITVPVALAIASLGLLTAYFREPVDGPLHVYQRELGDRFAPLSGAVQRVSQPVRDASEWTRNAREAVAERDRLRTENAQLQQELARRSLDEQRLQELERLLAYTRSKVFSDLKGYEAKAARVLVRTPGVYSSKVLIDQGSNAGIKLDDPVLAAVGKDLVVDGAALVGRVTAVEKLTSEVTLISDPALSVAATVAGTRGGDGVLQPAPGDPSVEVLDFVRKTADVKPGQPVVTSGFSLPGSAIRSFFPEGIPIGFVTFVNQSDTANYKTIQVTPWVDLGAFRSVLVLSRPVE